MGKLVDELKKRNPFEHAEQEAYLNLIRTAQCLSHPIEQALKQHGLSEATYNVLRILRGAGGDGLPSLEIASRMVTRVPDITRLVDRLVQAKLVERGSMPNDRRVVLVRITQAGLDLLAELDQPLLQTLKSLLGHLSASELEQLIRLLERAREHVPDACKTSPPLTT